MRDMNGSKNPRWNGGKYTDVAGYVHIKAPSHPYSDSRGYVSEHRLVIEQKLGRYLLPTEHVDHINEIKNDNRPENLQVVSNRMNKKLDFLRNGHPFQGKHHSKESNQKNRNKHLGNKASLLTKLKMSISGKRAWDKRRVATL